MNTNELSISCETFITFHNLQIIGLSNINESLYEHNIVYKVINKINGKHYIGQHVTLNPLDEYAGSGNMITKALHKYGLSTFIKEILFDFNNFDDMNQKEIELVPLSSCYPYDQSSYNLMEGGHCGRLTNETKKKLSESKKGEKNPQHKSHGRINPVTGKTVLERFHNDKVKYDAWRKANSERHKGKNTGEQNYWHKSHGRTLPMNRKDAQERSRLKRIGQKRTNEQKKRMSENRKGKCCGKDHVFYKKSLKERLKDETIKAIGKTRDDVICPQDFMNEHEIAEWKNKLSKAFTGRIRIYNPITNERHTINQSELENYINLGWIIGYNCSSIGGKIAIHNPKTKKTKYIFKDELEKFIDLGWLKGAYVDSNKIHKIAIYNDIIDKTILIDPHQYVAYYYDGWSLDLPHHTTKGKVIIRNEITHETKAICKNELQSYLDNGWKKGRFPNSKPKIRKANKLKFNKFKS